MKPRSARASVEVAVDPLTAFKAFTEEIGQWWVPGPVNFRDSARAVTNRIEPGVGGRVMEVYDEARSPGSPARRSGPETRARPLPLDDE
jgi:hypothetical protein